MEHSTTDLFFERETAPDPCTLFKMFLDIGLDEYFGYLTKTCDPKQLKKYDPERVLAVLKNFSVLEPKFDRNNLTIGMLLYMALQIADNSYCYKNYKQIRTIAAPDGSALIYIVSKLILTPLLMLDKMKGENDHA